jgi:hypothetical protein
MSRPSSAQRGQKRHDLVAVGHPAALVQDHHPVGIAIQADAHMRAMRHHRLGRRLGMRRPAMMVDVGPVRRHAHRDHLGPQFPQHLRRRAIGRAIGAVDHHLQPIQPQARRKARLDELLIAAPPVLDPLGAADVFRLGGRDLALDHRLDLGLGGIRQLEPVRPEELDAVVLVRVVAGRDHHAEVRPHAARQIPDRRRRHRAEQEHVHASRGQPRRQRVFQHVARQPRVLADHHPVRGTPVTAEVAPRSRAEP